MKFISHRGNLYGQDLSTENSPEQIKKCIELGYDVEIDLWSIEDQLYLGHDEPKYQIDPKWILSYDKHIWVHCKNKEALDFCMTEKGPSNFFSHDRDEYTITYAGYIWANIGILPIQNTIIVMPEKAFWNSDHIRKLNPEGICSDIIVQYKEELC